MTNQLALILGGLILTALLLDIAIFGDEHMIFLGKKFADLLHWIAFWR